MRATTLICLLAVVLAGCGAVNQDSSKDFKGEERAAAAAVEGLEKAARDEDAAKVCKQLLTRSLLDALAKKGTNCVTGVKEAFKDADSFDIKVDDVKISGATATVKVTSGLPGSTQKTDSLLLERDGRAWKISALQG